MRRMNRRTAILIVSLTAGCAKTGPLPLAQMPDVDMTAAMGHIKVLSSDEYEGRAPGTRGEALTVAYLIDQFKKIGLKPGNTDGTYVQKVPLVGITPAPAPLVFAKGTQQITLKL